MRKLCPTRAKVQDHLARGALALWRDTDGLMVPYVAVMLPVLVGFALLALDGSRRMSLQTQMQAAADSLALAGARELNEQTGANARHLCNGERACGDEIVQHPLWGRIGAESGLYVRFLFEPSAASDGIGARPRAAIGRKVRRGEDHSATGQRCFQRRS